MQPVHIRKWLSKRDGGEITSNIWSGLVDTRKKTLLQTLDSVFIHSQEQFWHGHVKLGSSLYSAGRTYILPQNDQPWQLGSTLQPVDHRPHRLTPLPSNLLRYSQTFRRLCWIAPPRPPPPPPRQQTHTMSSVNKLIAWYCQVTMPIFVYEDNPAISIWTGWSAHTSLDSMKRIRVL